MILRDAVVGVHFGHLNCMSLVQVAFLDAAVLLMRHILLPVRIVFRQLLFIFLLFFVWFIDLVQL